MKQAYEKTLAVVKNLTHLTCLTGRRTAAPSTRLPQRGPARDRSRSHLAGGRQATHLQPACSGYQVESTQVLDTTCQKDLQKKHENVRKYEILSPRLVHAARQVKEDDDDFRT